MVRLNREMMARYEIPVTRPQTLRALIFGADGDMLLILARALDALNTAGGDTGAAVIAAGGATAALAAQDGMFTIKLRGEDVRRECVVQTVLLAIDPERDFKAFLETAAQPEAALFFCHAHADAVEAGLLARALVERRRARQTPPTIIALSGRPDDAHLEALRTLVLHLCGEWDAADAAADAHWICARTDSLCGFMEAHEAKTTCNEMNYADALVAWGEPFLRITLDAPMPPALVGGDAFCTAADFPGDCAQHARIFDATRTLAVALGYTVGLDSLAQVFADTQLRAFIGHAVTDEILPELEAPRETLAPAVISTFERLENPMNFVRLTEAGRNLVSDFRYTLYPPLAARCRRQGPPMRLTLALAALIMLYAGARLQDGAYRVCHGERSDVLWDDEAVLARFALLAHDMPAETLTYAALADREAWGCDLRQDEDLEAQVARDLASIQSLGLRETMRRLSAEEA